MSSSGTSGWRGLTIAHGVHANQLAPEVVGRAGTSGGRDAGLVMQGRKGPAELV